MPISMSLRLILMAILTGLAAFVFTRPRVEKMPVSFAEQSDTFDFGLKNAGETLRHTFVIRNPLAIPVKIENAFTSCSCLVAGQRDELVGQAIPSGGSIQVPLVMSTNGQVGNIEGTVAVILKAEEAAALTHPKLTGNQNRVLFKIFAYVPPDMESVPAEIDFGKVDIEQAGFQGTKNATFKFSRPGLTWEFVRVTDPIFQLTPHPNTDSLEISIDVANSQQRSTGRIKAFAEIRISDSKQEKLFLPIDIELVERLAIEPPFLSFFKTQSKEITLTGVNPFRILEVSINDTAIQIPNDVCRSVHRISIPLPSTEPERGVVKIKAEFEISKDIVVKKIDYFDLEREPK